MALEEFVYVYGVCHCPTTEVTPPLGLEREIQIICVDQIAAIVEFGIDLEALQSDDQRLLNAVLSHDRVVCDLFQQFTILPIRFGTQTWLPPKSSKNTSAMSTRPTWKKTAGPRPKMRVSS